MTTSFQTLTPLFPGEEALADLSFASQTPPPCEELVSPTWWQTPGVFGLALSKGCSDALEPNTVTSESVLP